MLKRGLVLALLIVIFSCFAVSAENLNLKITGTINNYTSDLRIKTSSSSSAGIDGYDMIAPSSPDNYASFSSTVLSQSLSVDSFSASSLPRTIPLVFHMSAIQSGTIAFSWDSLASTSYSGTFNYCSDSSCATVSGTQDMRASTSYSATVTNEDDVYAQVVLTSYVAPTTPAPQTPSGGGGGGGGAPAVVKGLVLDTSEATIDLVSNYSKDQVVRVENTGTTEQTVTISQKGLSGLVSFEETSFKLAAGESKDVRIIFSGNLEPGVYAGKVIIGGREIMVAVNLKSKELLFDALVSIPEANKFVKPGGNLDAQITLIPMGDGSRADVTLTYTIKDFEGRTYITESETILVEEQKSFKKQFYTSQLPSGKYVLGLELTYPGGIATSSSHFEVQEAGFNLLSRLNIFFFVMIGLLIILIIYVAVARLKYRKKFRNKK